VATIFSWQKLKRATIMEGGYLFIDPESERLSVVVKRNI
jgi:hypothetical protein